MSAAIHAQSAKARATIAIRLLKRTKPRPRGRGLGRNFDDCFEMGDGVPVYSIVIERATSDQELLAAIDRHGLRAWAVAVEQLRVHHVWIYGDDHRWQTCPDGEWPDLESALDFAEDEVGVPWIVVDHAGAPVAFGDHLGRFWPEKERR